MRLILSSLLVLLPATALADPTIDVRKMATDDCAKARKAGKTCVLEIGEETIEGQVGTGSGEKVTAIDFGRAASLIRLRRDFIPEILRTAEDLD